MGEKGTVWSNITRCNVRLRGTDFFWIIPWNACRKYRNSPCNINKIYYLTLIWSFFKFIFKVIIYIYLKGTNFRGYLFSRAKKNCILRVLIFANGYEQKILRVLIFANSKKIRFFRTRNRQNKWYSISQSLGKSTRF